MPPSIDADLSPNRPPSPLARSDRDGSTTTAFPVVETASNEDGNGLNSDDAADPTSLLESIEFVSREVFATEKLRDFQKGAIQLCINPSLFDSKLLLVTRTGSGKSHVMRTLGVLVGGVVIIFVPLLSLSADQMNKMKEASQKYGTVETHNLDEFPTDDGGHKLARLVKRIDEERNNNVNHLPLYLTAIPIRNVLRVVGIDEAHLFVQHSSFRVEIHMLTELFFKKIFDEDDKSHPIFLAMTATMPLQYIPKLEELTNVSLEKCREFRPAPEHFMQQNIKMEYHVNTVTFATALDKLVAVIRNTVSDSVVVLTTLPATAKSLEAKLCEKLNKAKCNVDVVIVHGQLPKMDKFINMRLFCAKLVFEYFCPRALVTNGAGNTGIDSPSVTGMVRAGWAMNLSTVFQERGRCARGERMSGFIDYLCNIKSLLENLHLIYELGTSSAGGGGNNEPSSTNADEDASYKRVRKLCMIRMENEKKKSLEEKEVMQLEVLKFFCLNAGCYHLKAAAYLSAGKLKPVDTSERCQNMCSMCDGSWHKLHKPVVQMQLISWFQSFEFREPIKTADDPHSLTDLLWNDSKGWKEKIFGCESDKTIKKYHVECLMQSLIASEIIIWRVVEGKIEWWRNRVGGQNGNVYCYMIRQYWEGIPLA